MNIVNLTPHDLHIYDNDKNLVVTLPRSGQIARIGVSRVQNGTVNGIPTFTTELGEPEGLPEMVEGTIYVVSGIFRSNCPRQDLWQPGELLRDDNGRPIGCVGLSQ